MSHSFRFLEHMALADIAFEAEGDSAEEVFRGATRALLEIMADPMSVTASWERAIMKTDESLEDLLVEWLSEILYWKDADGVVFHDAPLTLTCGKDRWMLEARLIGAPVDGERQELRNDVKGITKHMYRMKQEGAIWKARVVVDV
jgi:SHS2 domain-containing protein